MNSTKTITKTWLAKVAAISNHRTSLLHRISVLGFFNSKMYISSFHCSFGVLVFTFDMHVWITYHSCIIKNNRNNMMYYGRRKIKQMLSEASYHICSFKRNNSRISLLQLSVSYIFKENSLSKGKIVDNKNVMKLLTCQIFCL